MKTAKLKPFVLTVRVTREDIRRHLKNSGEPLTCPIAKAIRRALMAKTKKIRLDRGAVAVWIGEVQFYDYRTVILTNAQERQHHRVRCAPLRASDAKPFTWKLKLKPRG